MPEIKSGMAFLSKNDKTNKGVWPHPPRHRNYHPNREYMKYIRISPNVEYSTDMDFFLENQILCIVDKEGTKFCSLIENRLFMRSKNRRISKRMQEHIMREIHSDICRLCYGGEPVDWPATPHTWQVTVLKSRAVLIGLPDFFSTFPLKKKQILYLVGVKLAIFI